MGANVLSLMDCPPQSLLMHTNNTSSGILLDEPLSSQKECTLLLLQPAPGEPCYLHINIQRMGGYCPTAVEITSGSRTVEVYCDDEYLGTTRGAFTRKTE